MKLKTDEEYKKIDEEDEKRRIKSDEESRIKIFFEDFDKNNKYYLEFIKAMPENIQLQIIQGSPFPSTAVMLWLSIGNAKERDMKLYLIKEWEKDKRKK